MLNNNIRSALADKLAEMCLEFYHCVERLFDELNVPDDEYDSTQVYYWERRRNAARLAIECVAVPFGLNVHDVLITYKTVHKKYKYQDERIVETHMAMYYLLVNAEYSSDSRALTTGERLLMIEYQLHK